MLKNLKKSVKSKEKPSFKRFALNFNLFLVVLEIKKTNSI